MASKKEKSKDDASKKDRRGLMTLVKATAFVSVIVLLEIAAASMLLPDAEKTRAVSQQLAATADGEEGAGTVDDASAATLLEGEDTREVNLGEFHVLTYDPDTGASLTIDFELFGVVVENEESEFYNQFAANQQRISEQINITMRAMEVSDFADPGLGLIRRKLLEKVNRALGKPLLRGVIFPKFSYIER